MQSELLRAALDTAVAKHFSQLFEVLMVASDDQEMRRFEKGLRKLIDTEARVAAVIELLEEPLRGE